MPKTARSPPKTASLIGKTRSSDLGATPIREEANHTNPIAYRP